MGVIRGSHISPGVYTRSISDGRVISTRNNRKGTIEKKPQSGGSGGGKKYDGIKFTSLSGNTTIGLVKRSTNHTTLEYSKDKENWFDFNTGITIVLVNANDEVYVRGKLIDNNTEENFTQFSVVGKTSVSGNINSIFGTDKIFEYCCCQLFLNCPGLVDASELTLPSKTLANSCYRYMFENCTGLIKGPELLPATNLSGAIYCYRSMFFSCSSLIQIPKLPATILSEGCYYSMFNRCSSLVQAPNLPATELAYACYRGMFYNCTSLTKVQEILPATNLPEGTYTNPMEPYGEWGTIEGCYSYMFWACSNLVNPPILPAKKLKTSCYACMFSGCSRLGNLTLLAEDLTIDNLSTTFANNMSPTIDMFHNNGGPDWGISLTQSAMNQFNTDSVIQEYYTHKPPVSKRHVLTQEEIDEIVERYHIHYDD